MIFSLLLSNAFALEDDYTFELEGYFRMRSYSYRNLYFEQSEPGRYVAQRLRIQPMLNFQDRAKFMFMADVLDDVVWGDNQQLASTSLFAGDPSNTGRDGEFEPSFVLKRAWMEFDVAVGTMRVGRQPSHWGLGLLANSGDGFDDAFGENHSGANFDRILFATKPIAVAQTLMGKTVQDIPFFMGYAFDRLVEDPETQYYGFICDDPSDFNQPAFYEGDEFYDPSCDANGDGRVDSTEAHGNTEERDPSSRPLDWAMDNSDDVNEHVVLAIYKGENIDLAGSKADLTIGAYGINRNQKETDSNVMIYDGYLYFLYRNMYLEGEFLNIRGSSRAIPLLSSDEDDPLYKDVNIWGYAAKGGYKTNDFSIVFETGYASGDEDVTDNSFTARSIHPDYNVGLIIYDEVLAVVTQNSWQGPTAALRSQGGIYNSRYIFPVVEYTFFGDWQVLAGYLKVWPDKADGAVIQCNAADEAEFGCNATAESNEIGWEVDLAFKTKIHNHIHFAVEGAYAEVTDRIQLNSASGLNSDGKFTTIQTRFAYEF